MLVTFIILRHFVKYIEKMLLTVKLTKHKLITNVTNFITPNVFEKYNLFMK